MKNKNNKKSSQSLKTRALVIVLFFNKKKATFFITATNSSNLGSDVCIRSTKRHKALLFNSPFPFPEIELTVPPV
jgi:hypothetical protein